MSWIGWSVQTEGPEAGRYGVYELSETGKLLPSAAEPEFVLVPGFVDVHIHGAFGFDFMMSSPSELVAWADKLEEHGYEAFLPTTVTQSLDAVLSAIDNLPAHRLIQGFHLEGPFISPKHPGAQPPHAILDPIDLEGTGWNQVLDHPALRLITLAPERPGGLELTKRLSKRGVIVSMGHTDATFEEANRAFAEGVTHSTHTYNAMRGLHHREAGTVGAIFLNHSVNAELIYDRIHVSKPAAEVLIKAKGADRVIGVSDSTLAAGLPTGTTLTMWGLDCVVGEGQIRLASNGSLAGSAVTLDQVFANLLVDFGAEVAIKATSLNPRRILGLEGAPKVWLKVDSHGRILDRIRFEA